MKKRAILGWREWVALPDFGVKRIKAKVDTGARTSALHVSSMEFERVGRKEYVLFKIHPRQKKRIPSIVCRAVLIEHRTVKSSVGTLTTRPVIEINLQVGKQSFPIEITLVNRDMMGFRMLLGRQALRGRFLVDPGKSFLVSKNKKSIAQARSLS